MKFAITTAALLFVLGTAASTHAQEKNQEHHEDSKPAQQQHQQSKPAQQQSKPAEHQQAEHQQAQQHHETKPAEHQQAQQSHPAAQQHSQPAARTQQQSHSESHAQNNNNNHGNENHGDHGRISNAHYQSNFGREHSFHVNRADYDRHRFAYGGYNWGFIDPWPVAWGYSDDVYVIYADGGYYMYNRFHPGARIAININ